METPFFWQARLVAADCHVKIVEFQTDLACVAEGVGAILRNLHRLLDAAFGSGIVVTFPVGAREIEKERRVLRFLVRGLLKQTDALLVILPSPCLLGFPVKLLYRRIRFVLVRAIHVFKRILDS